MHWKDTFLFNTLINIQARESVAYKITVVENNRGIAITNLKMMNLFCPKEVQNVDENKFIH